MILSVNANAVAVVVDVVHLAVVVVGFRFRFDAVRAAKVVAVAVDVVAEPAAGHSQHLQDLLVRWHGLEPLQEERRPQVVLQPLDVLGPDDVTGGCGLHFAAPLPEPVKE